MRYVLGVDGGGSKTLAVLAGEDGGAQVWRGGGVDPFAGPDWRDRLGAALRAFRGFDAPAAAVIGLPNFGEAPETERQQAALIARQLGQVPHLLMNDVDAAFSGAFPAGRGVLILAGTGSMAWAGDGRKTVRVGGFGDVFGDEGSAFWLGREALSRAAQALDGRARGQDFARRILHAAGAGPEELIAWAYGLSGRRAAIAALAPAVCQAATAGDATAVALIRAAARELAAHVRAARRRLSSPGLPWSWAGGLFACRLLRAQLEALLGPATAPALPPVGGAVLRAARLAGFATGPEFVAALALSLSPAEPDGAPL